MRYIKCLQNNSITTRGETIQWNKCYTFFPLINLTFSIVCVVCVCLCVYVQVELIYEHSLRALNETNEKKIIFNYIVVVG